MSVSNILASMKANVGFMFRFKGFMQVYQLQTENDEEETWRDLVSSNFPFKSLLLINSQQVDARV